MSVIIDRALTQKVQEYNSGRFDLPALTALIQKSKDPKAVVSHLMAQIFKVINKEKNDLNVKDTPKLRSLYESLCTLHEQNLAVATVKSVAAQHIVAARHTSNNAVNASMLLSNLFNSTSKALTVENFTPIHIIRKENEGPLSITLSSNSPNLDQSIKLAQTICGPIVNLTITDEFESSEEELCALVNACPHLTGLTLPSATDTIVKGIKWPQNLSLLDIKDSFFTKTGLQTLCDLCPDLRSLNIRDCPNISHIDMMDVTYPALLVDFAYDAFWEHDIVVMDEGDDNAVSNEPRDCQSEFIKICNAAEEHKDSPVALTIAAVALLESMEVEKARATTWLMGALECNGQFLPATVQLKELQRQGAYQVKAIPKDAEQNLDSRLKEFKEHAPLLACKARFLLDRGDVEEAHIIAHFAYEKDNKDDFVLATMAEVCRRMNHPVLAEDFCRRALDDNPRNVYALNTLAALSANTNLEQAIQLYKDACKISCYNPSANLGLAALYLTMNRLETNQEAVTLLNTVLQTNPNSGHAHFELARLYARSDLQGIQQNVQSSARHAAEAKKFATDPALIEAIANPFAIPSFVEEVQNKKRLSKADDEDMSSGQAAVKKGKPLEAESENRPAFVSSDEIVANTEEHARALQRCELAFSKKPDDLCSLVMLGELLLPTDPDRGIKYLKQVLESKGDYVKDACIALADYHSIHNETWTNTLLTRANEIDDSDPRVHLTYAKFQLLLADPECAQESVSFVLEKDANNPRALVLQAKLQLLYKEPAKASDTVEYLIANTKFGNKTRIDVMMLLCEYPELLRDKRHQALKLLFPA